MSKHKIIGVTEYTPTVFTVSFTKGDIDFIPGACVSIKGKPYSIASNPNEKYITLCIRKMPSGRVSGYLYSLSIGEIIEIDEVFNYFKPGSCCNDGEFIYFATGVGVSPFLSAVQYYKDKLPAAIYYGARTREERIGIDCLRQVSCVTYSTLSRDNPEPLYNPIPTHLNDQRILDTIQISPNFKYYLCGVNGMINDVSSFLINQGIKSEQIISELFFM